MLRWFSGVLILASLQGQVKVTDPGVKKPELIKRVEPGYPEEARRARQQGTAILLVVIDEQGVPSRIKIVSPLGHGLDEQAVAAVEQWRFKPATKDGIPVAVEAQVEVNFRFQGSQFNTKVEGARSTYNLGVDHLNRKEYQQAIKSFEAAAAAEFGPSLVALGKVYLEGLGVSADSKRAADYARRAADLKVPAGQFLLGTLYEEGLGVDRDYAEAIRLYELAAKQNFPAAEYSLGRHAEKGTVAAPDLKQALKWFRRAANDDDALAQFRLAQLLGSAEAPKQDKIEALGWALRAQDHGQSGADLIVNRLVLELPAADVLKAQSRSSKK
jgi:TonB family protein